MTTTTTPTIQVKIITRNGRQKAGYRSMLVNGQWNTTWFHMTVADARRALRDGVAHVGIDENCTVVGG